MTIQTGVPVARIELLDEAQMDAINKYSKLDHRVAPTLFFEFHGTEAGVAEQVEMVKAIAGEHGGDDFRWATTAEERSKAVAGAPRRLLRCAGVAAGIKGLADGCVRADLASRRMHRRNQARSGAIVRSPRRWRAMSATAISILIFMIDPQSPEEIAEASRLNDRMVARALEMEGTCTGEHGIGYGKMDFLIAEHGEAVSVMRSIK